METTSRKQHWERIYTTKSPHEVSWYQDEPTLSLAFIEATGARAEDRILDVGGGASVLVDHLLGRGYRNVAVLDVSGQALAHARERLGDRADAVTWYEADVTAFEPTEPVAVWHDRAVFHFLTEAADRRRYVEVLERALEPGGHAILAAFAPGGPTRCSGLEIVQYDAAKLQRELGEAFELVDEARELHHTPSGGEQAFRYVRFVKRSEATSG